VFHYDLPPERIAQRPVAGERSASRLLNATGETLLDQQVAELPRLLRSGDLLLLNDTKVRPCRFFPPELPSSEVFLIARCGDRSYRALARPLKRFSVGQAFALSQDMNAVVTHIERAAGEAVLELSAALTTDSLEELIEQQGVMPIPPYIREGRSDSEDRVRYQTVFAQAPGSIAAPTAALHFTEELLTNVRAAGAEIRFLTLHVGLSSILSLERQTGSGKVGSERFVVPKDTFDSIRRAKAEKRRVIGVGTTVTRATESLSESDWRGDYDFAERDTDLFIQPGFTFKVLDLLMTNFHQPGSTHLTLVSAFAGEERIRAAYEHALQSGYRFLSYGDSMLLSRCGREM